MKVFVYRNLNRKGYVYSLKAVDGKHKGKVIGYSSKFGLRDATMKVSEKGRKRVLKEKKKNVHAGIIGDLWYCDDYQPRNLKKLNQKPFESVLMKPTGEITYNPYKYKTFVTISTQQEVLESDFVMFDNQTVLILSKVTSSQ